MKLETLFKIMPRISPKNGRPKPELPGPPLGTQLGPPISNFKTRRWNIQRQLIKPSGKNRMLQSESRSGLERLSAFSSPAETLTRTKNNFGTQSCAQNGRWI